jgi:hypothetical protein
VVVPLANASLIRPNIAGSVAKRDDSWGESPKTWFQFSEEEEDEDMFSSVFPKVKVEDQGEGWELEWFIRSLF